MHPRVGWSLPASRLRAPNYEAREFESLVALRKITSLLHALKEKLSHVLERLVMLNQSSQPDISVCTRFRQHAIQFGSVRYGSAEVFVELVVGNVHSIRQRTARRSAAATARKEQHLRRTSSVHAGCDRKLDGHLPELPPWLNRVFVADPHSANDRIGFLDFERVRFADRRVRADDKVVPVGSAPHLNATVRDSRDHRSEPAHLTFAHGPVVNVADIRLLEDEMFREVDQLFRPGIGGGPDLYQAVDTCNAPESLLFERMKVGISASSSALASRQFGGRSIFRCLVAMTILWPSNASI